MVRIFIELYIRRGFSTYIIISNNEPESIKRCKSCPKLVNEKYSTNFHQSLRKGLESLGIESLEDETALQSRVFPKHATYKKD